MLEVTPKASHASNAAAESAVGRIAGLVRSLRSRMELKLGMKISAKDSLLPWIVRHASFLYTRLNVRDNGSTAYEHIKGRPYSSELAELGEASCGKSP